MPDILDNLTRGGRAVPEPNATSDMPVVTPAEPPPPAPPPEADTPAVPEAPNTGEAIHDPNLPPEVAAPDPNPDARARREYRFADLTRQLGEERARAARAVEATAALTEQTRALMAKLEQLAPQPQPAAVPVAEARPTRDQFDSPEEYDAAMYRYAAREGARIATEEWERKQADQRAAAEKQQAEAAQQQTLQQIYDGWNARRTEAVEKYPDFEQVAELHPNMTLPMRDALWAAEDGPEIAYYLGKHQDEAAAITKMHPVQQIAAIARLGAKLSAPPPPVTPPTTPPPINPLRTGAAPEGDIYTNEPSMEQYGERRLRELRSARLPSNVGMVRN